MTPSPEDDLRAMLRDRAGHDVTTVPSRVLDAAVGGTGTTDGAAGALGAVHVRPARIRRTPLLVAASVVAVLAVSVGAVVLHARRDGSPRPAASPVDSTPAPDPAPRTGHADREVPLTYFGPASTPGFVKISYQAIGATQRLGLRPIGEADRPVSCNGCDDRQPTAYVTIHARGDFGPADLDGRHPVSGPYPDMLEGTATYDDTGVRVHTLAWPLSDGQWALAQGTTARTTSLDALRALARAARPTDRRAVALPLRLTRWPDRLPVSEVRLDFADSGTTPSIVFGTPSGPTLSVTLWQGRSFDDLVAPPMTATTTDGRPGRFSSDRLTFGARLTDERIVTLSLDAGSSSPSRSRADLQLVLGGLRWTPAGSTVPAERAIP